MADETSRSTSHAVSRRTLAAGVAWSVPVAATVVAAPAQAASIVKYPGINGWVLNSPVEQPGRCAWTLEVDSTRPGTGPDGAPFGLYIYDVEPGTTFAGASLTYWIIGSQNATWTTMSGHSSCWNGPVRGAPATKSDGQTYTPYTWTYTCPINAADYQVDPRDGVKRVLLGHFHVRASFTQPSDRCNNVTYWTQRKITIDTPNDGMPAIQYCFERRNGTLGALGYRSC